jgi:hypothetical protein
MTEAPEKDRSMPNTFVATMPGTFTMPTTVQVHDDGQPIGYLSDDQLTLDEIEAELAENRAMFRGVTDALNARMMQLHLLQLSRLGVSA